MSNKHIIEEWVAAFNEADVEKLVLLYHEKAINHQVAESPIEGKKALREMFERAFAHAHMTCIIENIFEENEWVIMEWRDPLGLRGCGFFQVKEERIVFQRGYWDKLTFLRQHNLPIPKG